MTPLLKIANVICFYPPYNFPEKNSKESYKNKIIHESNSKLYKIKQNLYMVYATIFGTLFCICWIDSISRILNPVAEMNIPIMLEILGRVLHMVLALIVHFGVVLNRKKYSCVLNLMSSVDKHFITTTQPKFNFLVLDVVLVQVSYISFFVFTTCWMFPSTKKLGIKMSYFEIVFAYSIYYSVTIYYLVLLNLIGSVGSKFEAFNEKLLKVHTNFQVDFINREQDYYFNRENGTEENIRWLSLICSQLFDLVNIINDTFGFVFLVLSMIILRNLVTFVQMAIFYGYVHISVLVTSSSWTIFTLVSLFMIIFNKLLIYRIM